jgi:hypothetical protein
MRNMSARNTTRRAYAAELLTAALLLVATTAAARNDRPSRAPVKGCAWEHLADAAVGLDAWVQRCDFGFRKIDFLYIANSLVVRFSDGGAPDPVVDVIDVGAGETAQAGIKRHFAAHTGPALAARCRLAPYRGVKPPAGVQRYTFVPNAAYRKELRAKADPNEVGDPPCGDWGDAPDGIQYFEVRSAGPVHKILFLRVGQDEPLFDEKTLRVIAPARTSAAK